MSIEFNADFSSFDAELKKLTESLVTTVEVIASSTSKLNSIKFDTFNESLTSTVSNIKELGAGAGGISEIFAVLKDQAMGVTSAFIRTNTSVDNFDSKITKTNENLKSAFNTKRLNTLTKRFTALNDSLAYLPAKVEKFKESLTGMTANFNNVVKITEKFATKLDKAFNGTEVIKQIANISKALKRFVTEVDRTTTSLKKLKGTNVDLNRTSVSARKAQQSMILFNQSIEKTNKNLTFLTHMALYKIFARLSQYIRQSIVTVNEFDKAIVEINSVVGGGLNINALKSSLREMSAAYGKTKDEITEAVYQIISLRFASTTAEAMSELNTVLLGSVALNTSLTETVEAVATAYNNYGDAVGTTENILAIFAKTIQLGKVRLSEFSNVVGNVYPLTSKLGVSLYETSAMFDVFTIKGLSTAKAGTQIRALMVALIKPTNEMSKAFTALGVSTAEEGIELFGFQGFLKKINEHYHENISLLGKALGRQRALNAFVSLSTGNYDKYNEALKETMSSMEAYNKIKTRPEDTQSGQFSQAIQNLKNAFEENFTQPFIDGVIALNNAFGPLIQSVFKFSSNLIMIGGAIYVFKKFNDFLKVSGVRIKTTIKGLKAYKAVSKMMYKQQVADKKRLLVLWKKDKLMLRSMGKEVKLLSVSFKKMSYEMVVDGQRVTMGLSRMQRSILITKNVFKLSMTAMKVAFVTAIETMKAVAGLLILDAVIMGIIYLFERLTESSNKTAYAIKKNNAEIRLSMEQMTGKVSVAIEKNNIKMQKSLDKVREKYKDVRDAALAAYDDIAGGIDFNKWNKGIEKENATLVKSINKALDAVISGYKKAVTEIEKSIKSLDTEIKKMSDTWAKDINKFMSGIKDNISLRVGLNNYDESKKKLEELRKKPGEIQKEYVMEMSTTDDPVATQEKYTKKLKEANAEITKQKEELEKMNLFWNDTVPPLYQGLSLDETKDKLKEIEDKLSDVFKELEKPKELEITSDTDIEDAKQTIKDYEALIKAEREAGINSYSEQLRLDKYKEKYKEELEAYRKLQKEKLEAEKANLKKAEELRKQFNKAYEDKDYKKMKELSSQMPDETTKTETTTLANNLENQKKAEELWNKIKEINEQQKEELKTIKDNTAETNRILKEQRDKYLAEQQVKLDMNELKLNFDKDKNWIGTNNLQKAEDKVTANKGDELLLSALKGSVEGNQASFNLLINELKRSKTGEEDYKKVLNYLVKLNNAATTDKSHENIQKFNEILNRVIKPKDLSKSSSPTGPTVASNGDAVPPKIIIEDKTSTTLTIEMDGEAVARQVIKSVKGMPDYSFA
jgi:TP901 family phage tail tape measure protein